MFTFLTALLTAGAQRLKQAVRVSLAVQISFMCCGPSVDGQFTRGRADSPNS